MLLAALVAYGAFAAQLPGLPLSAEVALTAGVLLPAALAVPYLALPLRTARGLGAVGGAVAVLAAVLVYADFDAAANAAKLVAVVLLALWFLGYFESPSWLVLVAALVPAVDALSVWRGPTRHIVTERPEVFDLFSFTFPLPETGAFQLGLTDVAFFTLFLGGAARWRFRVGWTWLALVGFLGATIALTVYVDPFGLAGLPALPALSLGFLVPNADHVLRVVRRLEERVDVGLDAADAQASARFYREAIGVRAAVDERGVVRLTADWWADREVGFRVRDLADAHLRATQHGAEVVHEPRDESWGRAAAYRDPDGRMVVLTQR